MAGAFYLDSALRREDVERVEQRVSTVNARDCPDDRLGLLAADGVVFRAVGGFHHEVPW